MNQARQVLVVEDEPAIATLARLYLERNGFGVRVAADAAAARRLLGERKADVILLDIALPGPANGLDLCRELRHGHDWTPVIFVTARDEEVDRVVGLELGADDYVTKPYSPRELVARVRAVLRRHDRADTAAPASLARAGHAGRENPADPSGADMSADTSRHTAEPTTLVVGSVRLDRERRRVWAGDAEVALTTTEFDLLAQLMSTAGRVYSRGELLQSVWGYPSDDGSRTVDVHVAQVRAKLGPASPIRTVRGVGYSADEDV